MSDRSCSQQLNKLIQEYIILYKIKVDIRSVELNFETQATSNEEKHFTASKNIRYPSSFECKLTTFILLVTFEIKGYFEF